MADTGFRSGQGPVATRITVTDNLHILFDRLIPEALEAFLQPLIGRLVPRVDQGERFLIRGMGRFRGAYTPDLLRLAHGQKLDGALVMADEDVTRILYFEQGMIVGSHSDMLFERVGRMLFKADVIAKADAHALVDCEEKAGLAAAMSLVPTEMARWALEKRGWEVGAALYFMGRGHYMFIDGRPRLGKIPTLAIDPMQLAMEGMRRYDEWRNGEGKAPQSAEPDTQVPARATLDRAALEHLAEEGRGADLLRPGRAAHDEADAILDALTGEDDPLSIFDD